MDGLDPNNFYHVIQADETYRENSTILTVDPITIDYTGQRGRPRKVVNLEFLKEAMSPHRRITITKLAQKLSMHRTTLTYYLKRYGVSHQFAQLTDADLDRVVKTFKSTKPESGIRYLIGFLQQHGVRVQKERLCQSLRRVDRIGYAIRHRNVIQRRKYTSPRPNALWHCDGHHKLIMWGIVIHGFVDGYCRTVSFLTHP
jgi:hypothetical protein